jgi:hypothetical protein
MGEYRPPDLQKGLKNSQVEGEDILACQASGIHAGFQLNHEETLNTGPSPKGPVMKGGRDIETLNKEYEKGTNQDGKYTNPIKPLKTNHRLVIHHFSQNSVPQGKGVETEVPHDRVTNRRGLQQSPYMLTQGGCM